MKKEWSAPFVETLDFSETAFFSSGDEVPGGGTGGTGGNVGGS